MNAPSNQGESLDQRLCALGVRELAALYRDRKLSPGDVTRATLHRIARLNPKLRAYLSVLEESALAGAGAVEQQFAAGIHLGPLQGVPIAVKDIVRVKGTRTTAASRVLIDAPPDGEDAVVVRRLRGAGAIIVGKTNLHEFARGAPGPQSPFGHVDNPRKLGHTCGDSSSGSASAVAAGLAVISLGTDTGGSIRNPASVCGVVGLKPTYGRVPLRGILPLSASLDHVGPLARSVFDVAASLAVIAGYDEADPTSALEPVPDYVGAIERGPQGVRLGLPTNPFYGFGQPEALSVLANARLALLELCLTGVPVEVPFAEETNRLSQLIIDVELWTYHEQFRDRDHLYGDDFLRRSVAGLETKAVDYVKGKALQAEIRRRWSELFQRIDILFLPANVAGAPTHGSASITVGGKPHPVNMVISRYNRAANVTGFPALVLPVGATREGLPIAAQLLASPFAEDRLLALAHALEQRLGNLPGQWGIEPRI